MFRLLSHGDSILYQRSAWRHVQPSATARPKNIATIYGASERDYRVVLVEDAISGLYDRGRSEMTNIGVTLVRTDTVVERLAAIHPH